MDGLVRISMVPASGAALDLALPAHVVVADLLPELVRLGRGPAGARLVTAVGREVAPATSLAAQEIPDGAVLALVGPEPAAVILDDPADELAQVVAAEVLGWHPRLLRPAARLACALFLVLSAGALTRGPSWSGAAAGSAVVLLGGAAGIAARRHRDRLLAATCGWAAAGFAAVAGDQYAGPVAACAAAAVSALVIARVVPDVGALVLPVAVAAVLLGGLASLVAQAHVDAGLVASVGMVGTGLGGAAVPRLALTAARGDPRRARELMRAVMAAFAVVMLILVAPTSAHGAAGAGLSAAVGIYTACRASRHHGAVDVLAGLVTGAAVVMLAGAVQVVSDPPSAGAVGVAGLAVAVVVGVAAADSGGLLRAGPRTALAIDRLESLALLAVVPLLVLAGGVVPLLGG